MIATNDVAGIKQEISYAVNALFQQFEKDNVRMPTTEEFRCLFAEQVEELLGSDHGWQQVERDALNVLSENEQKVWAAACELEAEIRFKRSQFEDYEVF
ncbi:hypothetical protein [Thaumasiovibrio sp. DFM-14]|uniref:hypothetical protein n=1 Tax=Thaumasiovibrio sp. DFM-14 TaxID=3384792 RepID=UPI0039A2368A